MWLLVACFLSQFAPGETTSPTFVDFRAVCQELKREQLTSQRELLLQLKPPPNSSVPFSKAEKLQLLEDIKAKEAELKRIEKDDKLLPAPQVIIQTMRDGQIGELFSRVNYKETSTTNNSGNKVSIDRIETAPAKLVVLKTTRSKAIVCSCDGVEFVLWRYKGQPVANGETIESRGIYRISGTYMIAGKPFPAIEPWEHNSEWQKKLKRPEPTGTIEVVLQPGPQP